MKVIKDHLCSWLSQFVVTDGHSIFEFIEVSQLIKCYSGCIISVWFSAVVVTVELYIGALWQNGRYVQE